MFLRLRFNGVQWKRKWFGNFCIIKFENKKREHSWFYSKKINSQTRFQKILRNIVNTNEIFFIYGFFDNVIYLLDHRAYRTLQKRIFCTHQRRLISSSSNSVNFSQLSLSKNTQLFQIFITLPKKDYFIYFNIFLF